MPSWNGCCFSSTRVCASKGTASFCMPDSGDVVQYKQGKEICVLCTVQLFCYMTCSFCLISFNRWLTFDLYRCVVLQPVHYTCCCCCACNCMHIALAVLTIQHFCYNTSCAVNANNSVVLMALLDSAHFHKCLWELYCFNGALWCN